jgi:hypothetical protein
MTSGNINVFAVLSACKHFRELEMCFALDSRTVYLLYCVQLLRVEFVF